MQAANVHAHFIALIAWETIVKKLPDQLTSQRSGMIEVGKLEGVWEHNNLALLFSKVISVIPQIS